MLMSEEEIKQMIKYQRITESSIHPDTGAIVPFYMRMSGFVIFNTPLLLAVLFTPN